MKFIIKGISISILFILLTSCKDNQAHSEKAVQEPIKVEILAPNELSMGETVKLQVKVTQANESVNDADEVEFEIWKGDDRDHSVMLPARNVRDGIYEASRAFDDEGTYNIQTHVTARSMHSMPTKQVVVGEVNKDVQEDEEH
ncbi:FixH family protein [Bacillus gobiensis]|uniref:FixH family protein n=1 Tax=Bacillus gobiensis TaxID=1441095 RepID=UPI003D206CCA